MKTIRKYKNGKWYEEHYKDGKKYSLTFFHEDGSRKRVEHYNKDGEWSGKSTHYLKNGDIKEEENYKDGEMYMMKITTTTHKQMGYMVNGVMVRIKDE